MLELSVVVPTFNRLDRLRQVIRALEAQTYPHDLFEVIVISDGSTDGTDEFLQEIETPLNLRPVFQENQGVAVVRNRGIAEATASIVLFLDDDVVPDPCLLEEHMRIHQERDNVVVIGPMLTPSDFVMWPWVKWEQAQLTKQYDAMTSGKWDPTARQFYTGNASLRLTDVRAAGGFDPSFRRAEDVELAYRLSDMGLCFFYHPDAIGYHYAERSFSSWITTPYVYGRNDVIFSRDKNQSWLLPQLFREFRYRNIIVILISLFCLDRPTLTEWTIKGLKKFAEMVDDASLERVSQLIYSGIFNLRYYQGVSDELGGRRLFWKGVFNAG
ncbi:MAG: glycosyltransferase [Ardenticatenaceae bacterium]|nr:glycosyltransferase [Ardenticatenaceae bacterium]MCB9442661.1 glycosyltransferase [Ardenticatenaceae bacterium]